MTVVSVFRQHHRPRIFTHQQAPSEICFLHGITQLNTSEYRPTQLNSASCGNLEISGSILLYVHRLTDLHTIYRHGPLSTIYSEPIVLLFLLSKQLKPMYCMTALLMAEPCRYVCADTQVLPTSFHFNASAVFHLNIFFFRFHSLSVNQRCSQGHAP